MMDTRTVLLVAIGGCGLLTTALSFAPWIRFENLGDDTVARILLFLHSEILAAMRNELVQFFERIVVEQELNSLPGRQLASRLLPGLSFGTAAGLGMPVEVAEPL